MTSPTSDRRFGLVGNVALKAPCKAVSVANITLSGQQTIDGVALLAVNAAGVADRVLVTGQTSSVNNGIYDVSTSAWTRSVDCNGPYDLAKGTQVNVTDGTIYATTGWLLTTAAPITIGTTALTWVLGTGLSVATSAAAALASAINAAASAATAVAAANTAAAAVLAAIQGYASAAAVSAANAAASAAAMALLARGSAVSTEAFTGVGPYTLSNGAATSMLAIYVNGQRWPLTLFTLTNGNKTATATATGAVGLNANSQILVDWV